MSDRFYDAFVSVQVLPTRSENWTKIRAQNNKKDSNTCQGKNL